MAMPSLLRQEKQKMTYHYNYESELNVARIQQILNMCKKSPTCAHDVADAINVKLDIARAFMRHLISVKWVHVSEYKLRGRSWTKYYSIGDKESVTIDNYVDGYYMTSKQKKALADAKRYRRNYTIKTGRANKQDVEPVRVVPKIIKPDIHSAWLFNPILK